LLCGGGGGGGGGSDLSDPTHLLGVGDEVECNIFREKKTGKHGVTRLTLIRANPLGRERGVVSSVRETFGFIACADSTAPDGSNECFFHFSELANPKELPQKVSDVSPFPPLPLIPASLIPHSHSPTHRCTVFASDGWMNRAIAWSLRL
jgi:hypothetical protein